MRQETSAGAVIFYLESQEPLFLLLKYPSYWGFAKGRVEPGESEEETAKREVKEETGLQVSLIPGFSHEQAWFFKLNNETISKRGIFFLSQVSIEEAKKVKISDEHEDFAWKNYEDAIKLMKIKANKEMLKSALDFIKEYKKQKKLF